MKSGHRVFRWMVGGAITAGAAGAVLAFAGIDTPARVPLVLFFLSAAPTAAVASLLPGFDLLSRLVVAGTAAVVLNLGVAVAMLAVGSWSPRTGLAIMTLISLLLAALRLLPRSSAHSMARPGA